jgi:hypothetical protein
MDFKVSIKFEYKNGRFRTVTWVETNPKVVEEEVDGEITKQRAATAEDVKNALRRGLSSLMRDEKIRSFYDRETGRTVIIRFSEVSEIEILVEEIKE